MSKNTKQQNKKRVNVSEADYQKFRRDQKTKKEIKGLVLMLLDKVKNWN